MEKISKHPNKMERMGMVALTFVVSIIVVGNAFAQEKMEMIFEGDTDSQLISKMLKSTDDIQELAEMRKDLELEMADLSIEIDELEAEAAGLKPDSLEGKLTKEALTAARQNMQLQFLKKAAPVIRMFTHLDKEAGDPIREYLRVPENFKVMHEDFVNRNSYTPSMFGLAFLNKINEARERLNNALKVAALDYYSGNLRSFMADYSALMGKNTDVEARKMVDDMFKRPGGSKAPVTGVGRINSILERR